MSELYKLKNHTHFCFSNIFSTNKIKSNIKEAFSHWVALLFIDTKGNFVYPVWCPQNFVTLEQVRNKEPKQKQKHKVK